MVVEGAKPESTVNQMRFKDKVVIITGSSSGIGQTTLLMMAKEGASVTIHGVTGKHIDETIELFHKENIPDSRVHRVQGPLDDEEVIKRLVNETVEKFGRLDVLVCNAAVSSIYGEGDYFSAKCLRYVLEINLVSAINLIQQSIPHLEKTKGNVILVSSSMSHRTSFIGHFYGISKAALDHYTRNAGILYGPLGIRVNSLRVGAVDTRMYSRVEKPNLTDRFVQQCLKSAALKRMATSDEIAHMIMFVASDQASFITSAVMDIDGGLCANAVQPPDDLLEQMSGLEPQSHGITMPKN